MNDESISQNDVGLQPSHRKRRRKLMCTDDADLDEEIIKK